MEISHKRSRKRIICPKLLSVEYSHLSNSVIHNSETGPKSFNK